MKPHNILITVLLTIILTACSTSAVTTTSSNPAVEVTTTSSPVETSMSGIVTFADPVLEAMIRSTMGKSEGEITLTEAQGVTRMDLTDSLQRQLSEFTPITNLDGLEAFTNLESLDLSQNAVTDISPLAGLTKLTALSLAGNPVTDVAPLAKLTNLKLLILSNCQAQDYSALSNLINLQVLWLDNSTISDVSSLASLTNLQALYLDKSSVEDYSSLENIYTTLANKDFIIPTTLKDLGFNLDPNNHEAYFDIELASFTITHDQWGPPSREDNQNIIRMTLYLNDEYKTSIGYYDVHKVYLCQMDKEGQPPVNYLYDIATGEYSIDGQDRANSEQMIRAALEVENGEDPLYAPVRFFNETIRNTFKMTPAKLFALPYEPPSLRNLGFFPVQEEAVYRYEYRSENDVDVQVHRPDWGEQDFDVQFFTEISDDYRLVVNYHLVEKRISFSADDNSQGGASFVYYEETGEFIDEWCSYPDLTVKDYFIKAFNDPAITDVYQHSVELAEQYFVDTFGMTAGELYALPTGE
jgi:hypothetical protein